MAEQLHVALRILRLKQVEARVGLKRSTLYQRVADGTFPAPVALGGGGSRAVGWIESEVDQWLRDRIAASRPRGIV